MYIMPGASLYELWNYHERLLAILASDRVPPCDEELATFPPPSEMVTKNSTLIAGLVVACFSVRLSMVPSGSGILSSTISLS
jgi:hypothetical protein